MNRILLAALLLLPCGLFAQDDETRVLSPSGNFEFRLYSGQPEGALWGRLAYEVLYKGKLLLTTSWMGLDIRDQEPFLGENPGFMYADKKSNSAQHYNSAVVHYMQNGTLGRKIDVEVRAFDDGVAFRYTLQPSATMVDFLVRDEKTEFDFADPSMLAHLPGKPDFDMPLVFPIDSGLFMEITEAGAQVSPAHAFLVRTPTGLITRLPRSKTETDAAFAGTTPMTWPWRIILVGPDRNTLRIPAL